MSSGIALTDEDRQPWLEAISEMLKQNSESMVVACSALRAQYREILDSAGEVTFVYLHGTRETLLSRLKSRSKSSDHFMPSSLLDNQLETLEPPNLESKTITVSIELPISTIIDNVLSEL